MKADACWWTSAVLALGALLLAWPLLLDWAEWPSGQARAASARQHHASARFAAHACIHRVGPA